MHRGRKARAEVAAKRQAAGDGAAGNAAAAVADASAPQEEEELEVADVMEAFGNLSTAEAEAAALKIQAIHRGRIARKGVVEKRASMKMVAPPLPPGEDEPEAPPPA